MKVPVGPLVSVAIGLVLLLLAEVGLAVFAPVPDPHAAERIVPGYVPSAHMPDQRYGIAIEGGLPGVEPVNGRVNYFTTNNMGFRGDALVRPKPADEWRIFTVGGSTMECLVLDDSRDLSRVLQDQLQTAHADRAVRVYNAGKSGDRSYDHLAMVSQRIAHLEPDVVVVFAGINDLLAGIFSVDYLHMERERIDGGDALRWLAAESQLYRRLNAAARRFAAARHARSRRPSSSRPTTPRRPHSSGRSPPSIVSPRSTSPPTRRTCDRSSPSPGPPEPGSCS